MKQKKFATEKHNVCRYRRPMKPNTHLNAAIIESIHYVHLK